MRDAVTIASAAELRKVILRALRDPEVRLKVLRRRWETASDPLAVWEAILICSGQEFPTWVRTYLNDCAARMLDDHRPLPAVLGGKPGPRPTLDDETAADRFVFAMTFAWGITCSMDTLDDALNLARRVLPAVDQSRDDLTLLRWLAREFDLPTPPRSLSSWRQAIVSPDVSEFIKDSDVTPPSACD